MGNTRPEYTHWEIDVAHKYTVHSKSLWKAIIAAAYLYIRYKLHLLPKEEYNKPTKLYGTKSGIPESNERAQGAPERRNAPHDRLEPFKNGSSHSKGSPN